MESSIKELLNQMEFVAKLHRLALAGKYKYKPSSQLFDEFIELKARAERQLLAEYNQQEVLLDWLLMGRITDEVMTLSRANHFCQDP